MFEAEIEMEERQSNWLPLVMIVGLGALVVGSIVYFFLESRKQLSPQEASQVVSELLKARGPVRLHFHTGNVTPSVDEKPGDPHYRLLEKAGLVKIGKWKGTALPISLTPQGQQLILDIPGVEIAKDDSSDTYTVPIAERVLVDVANVTMHGPNRATVNYTWKWQPSRLGELFEASADPFKSFSLWDRTVLIQKYGADFYKVEPAKASVHLVRNKQDKWQISMD